MADGVRVKPGGATDPEVHTDEVLVGGELRHVQRFKLGVGGDGVYDDVAPAAPLPVEDASIATVLADVLVELSQKLEAGGEVNLSPSTLAALETITISNQTANPETGLATQVTLASVLAAVDGLEGKDFATQATLVAILTELGQKFESGGEVVLAAATLAALETITIANPTADPETGLATQTTLEAMRSIVARENGGWDYHAGVAGSVSVSGRVLGIAAVAGTTAASMTIDGGDSIPIPASSSVEFAPRGNLDSPELIFTGTESFLVEIVA